MFAWAVQCFQVGPGFAVRPAQQMPGDGGALLMSDVTGFGLKEGVMGV